jgi:hypothetical protein
VATSPAELHTPSCRFEQFSQVAEVLRQDVENLKTLSTTEFWGSAYWVRWWLVAVVVLVEPVTTLTSILVGSLTARGSVLSTSHAERWLMI